MNEIENPPPSKPRAAKRVCKAVSAELPNMPPPTMPPIYVGVAWNLQQRHWSVVVFGPQQFVVETALRNLRPTHYRNSRVYRLSEEVA